MTTFDIALAPERKPLMRLATLAVWVISLCAFLSIAQHVIDAGFLRRDIAALQDGEAWRTGGWLSQVVLAAVGLIPSLTLQQTTLSLTAAVVVGLGFGLLYDRLRQRGWSAAGCIVLLILVGAHVGVLYSITAASRGLPLYFAIAILIPAIRHLESVGDVQSSIGLGLVMPLVLLAGPLSTPLILPLALGAALADPDGRRDPRAFVAMLLVAVLPALIVAIGIVGFFVQSGIGVGEVLVPYVLTYGTVQVGDVLGSLKVFAAFAPMLVVPIAYCFWPGLPEKRYVWSALAVVALPAYLAIARVTLNSTMQPYVPAVALIAAYLAWLSLVRLPILLRAFALAMLVLGVVLSWTQTGLWDDPEWKDALVSFGGAAPLAPLELRPSL